MSTPPYRHSTGRFALQVLFVVLIVAIILAGIYAGSFVVHVLWVTLSHAEPRTVEDAPAWLVIPSFVIAGILFAAINRLFRLIERLVRLCQKP